MQLRSPNSWKLIYFEFKGQKFKVTSHNKSVSVFRQNAILPLAAYISHAGFSLLQCPAAQAMLVAPGFFLRHFPTAYAAADTARFPCVELSQSSSGRNVASVGLSTLVSAGFFYLLFTAMSVHWVTDRMYAWPV